MEWTKSDQYGFYSRGINGIAKKPSNDNITPNIYCSKFTTSYRSNIFYQSTGNNVITIDMSGDIDISTDNSISADDFKAAMAGVYLFYETENEVSDLDNVAQINAGGSITSNSEVLPNVNFAIKCK